MGCCSRHPHQVPLLSAKHKKKRLQWARDRQHWTIEKWKIVTWSNESWFLLMMAETGFGVSSMSPWTHPAWCQWYRLIAVVYHDPICSNCMMPLHQCRPTSLWNVSDLKNPLPQIIQDILEAKGGPCGSELPSLPLLTHPLH